MAKNKSCRAVGNNKNKIMISFAFLTNLTQPNNKTAWKSFVNSSCEKFNLSAKNG